MLAIIYLEVPTMVLKKVTFHVCLSILKLKLYGKRGKMIKQITSHHPPNSFEICEKLMHQKLSEHFDSILSPIWQYDFRKVHIAPYCLLVMLGEGRNWLFYGPFQSIWLRGPQSSNDYSIFVWDSNLIP